MKLKSRLKEKIHLLIWAIAVLLIVPMLFSTHPKKFFYTQESNTESSKETSIEDVFAENTLSDSPPPENALPIISADLSGNSFTNKTNYIINENQLSFSLPDKEEGAVLIIHTYGTQGYSKENYILNNSTLKSEDENINVLCAGEALKEYLEQKGIEVIHDKTLFDKISYSNAYNFSTEAVKNHIKNNPNIKYVIDIQRDSVFSQKGNCVKAVTTTHKGKTAQIGFISGCDENGADFPHWKTNLSLSYALSQKLYQLDSKLSKGVTLLPSGYGQYTSEGFVTVEIGTAGNTPQEAKNAAEFLAEALCDIVY